MLWWLISDGFRIIAASMIVLGIVWRRLERKLSLCLVWLAAIVCKTSTLSSK